MIIKRQGLEQACIQRKYIKGQHTHEDMPNITSYQRKGNQNQTEDDFMLTRMTKIKNNKVSTEKAMGSWGLSCNCWQGCKMVESL